MIFSGLIGIRKKMKKIIILSPIIILLTISLFLFIFLLKGKDPSKPPSALLNESLPNFKSMPYL